MKNNEEVEINLTRRGRILADVITIGIALIVIAIVLIFK